MATKLGLSNFLLLITIALIWGSNYILIKVALFHFSALEMSFVRLLLTAVIILPFTFFYVRKTTSDQWRWCIVLGFTGNIIPFSLFAIAQTEINSSLAGMLGSLQPAFALLVAVYLYKRKTNRSQIIGILLGFIGALILLSAGDSIEFDITKTGYGSLVIIATLFYGFSINLIKEHLGDLRAMHITSIQLSTMLVPSLIGLLWVIEPKPVNFITDAALSLFAIFMLASVSSIFGVWLFTRLIRNTGPVVASSVAYLIPIVAIMWGLLDNETIYTQQVVGIFIVFCGLALINRPVVNVKID